MAHFKKLVGVMVVGNNGRYCVRFEWKNLIEKLGVGFV